jgi:predicted nucleotidyltransferase
VEAFPNFDVEAAARRINEANRKEDEMIATRRAAAQEEARRIAAELRARDPSIRSIWGFGSVFEAYRPFRMDSDIDLALEGGDIVRLFSTAEDSAFKVDLVDISGCEDEFARGIRERGTSL